MASPLPAQYDFRGMFTRPPTATLILMIVVGVTSLAGALDPTRTVAPFLYGLLHFTPAQVLDGWKLWTPFSYLLFARSLFDLLLYEVFVLWFLAAPMERQWGTRRFLYYLGGVSAGAAVAMTFLALFVPGLRGIEADGSRVALMSLFFAFLLMNWNATVFFFFFPIRATILLGFLLAFPVAQVLLGVWQPWIAPLFAMAIGYLMLKRGLSARRAWLHLKAWWIDRQLRRRARHLRVVPPPEREREPKPPRYLN